jgi:hypothetical protein
VAGPLPTGQCTTTSGVILAVDLSHFGGPLLRSCGSTPTTGYALLNQGGWRTTGTQHDGPAFICRIGYSGYQGGTQYPTPAQDACVLTPPASAYWSYWHADPGQDTWSYSQLGAMSYRPKPGSVDLWTFGTTDVAGSQGRPAYSPDAVRARNTAPVGGAPSSRPAPSTRPAQPPAAGPATTPPAGGGGAGAGAGTGGGGAGGGSRPGGRPGSTARPPGSTARPPGTPAAPARGTATTATAGSTPAPVAGSGSAPPVVDAAPAPAAATEPAGSALPAILAGGIAAVLAAAAGILTWRRRRAAD